MNRSGGDPTDIPETQYVVNDDNEIVVVDKCVDLEPPKMYAVILLNDDYTPMDFVVELLMQVFQHNESEAIKIMMDVHEKGEAVAAIYSYDIAESRVASVNVIAQNNKVPLRVEMRPE